MFWETLLEVDIAELQGTRPEAVPEVGARRAARASWA